MSQVRALLAAHSFWACSLVRLERSAHNRVAAGSNPARPMLAIFQNLIPTIFAISSKRMGYCQHFWWVMSEMGEIMVLTAQENWTDKSSSLPRRLNYSAQWKTRTLCGGERRHPPVYQALGKSLKKRTAALQLKALAALFQARIFFSDRPVLEERALVLAISRS